MKQWIVNKFKEAKEGRFKVFIICFLLVFAVASLNKLSKYYTNNLVVAVEILGLPIDKVLTTDSPVEMNLTVTTYGFNWLRYALMPPRMSLAVDNLTRADSFYVWIPSKHSYLIRSQLDKDVNWDTSSSEPFYINYDQFNQKKVPIELKASLTFAAGYDSFDKPILNPDSVTVVGPSEALKGIQSVQTVQFDKDQINANFEERIALEIPANSSIKLDLDEAIVKVNAEKFSEGSIEVPISLQFEGLNTQIKHFPKSTEVVFYTSLAQFPSIISEDFTVLCRFDSLSVDRGYLKPEITKWPEAVRNVKLGLSRVEFIVEAE